MILNTSVFISKVNEVLNIIDTDNVISTDIEARKDVNLFYAKFKINKDVFTIRFLCELDEDEESGYYKKGHIYQSKSIIKKCASIDEIIKELKEIKKEPIKNGTKIKCNNDIAYIMDNDEDISDLNYYIKYALENESYEELLKRIENGDSWYDTLIHYNDIEAI